jgi:hypothetical protein
MTEKNEMDYKKLNEEEMKKYFEDSKVEYIPNKKITEKQFNENISKILKPNINDKINSNSSEEKYIEKVSDPYRHLLSLKSQLLQNKNNIDEMISKYNNINSKVDLNDINNYSLLFSNLQKYKSKIDSLLNYDIIERNQNKVEEESDSDSEEEDSDDEKKKSQKKNENKAKNEENKKNIIKRREENEKLLKQIEESTSSLFRTSPGTNSLNENNISLTNHLISKLDSINEEMDTFLKLKITGIASNPLTQIKQQIISLDNQVNKIETIIGNFDFTKNKNTIFGTLKNFLKMSSETNKDWISNRFENSRTLDKMLENFNSQSDNKKLLGIYKQMCEGYMIYLNMEKYKEVISYLKKRLVVIKSIILNSEQFEYDINELNRLIKENEGKYEILKFKYLQALESFDKLDKVLKEINSLDALVKKKI